MCQKSMSDMCAKGVLLDVVRVLKGQGGMAWDGSEEGAEDQEDRRCWRRKVQMLGGTTGKDVSVLSQEWLNWRVRVQYRA